MVDDVYLKMVDHFNFGKPVAPFRTGHSISYMDDRLLDRLETDVRYVYPNQLPNSPILPEDTPNTFKDSCGQIWPQAQPYYYAGKVKPFCNNADGGISWPIPNSL